MNDEKPIADSSRGNGTGGSGPSASGTGLDANVASLLAYVFGWISGLIIFLLEKDNKLVRFHALQSIGFNIAFVAGWLALGILTGILGAIPGIGGLLAGLLTGVWLLVFGLGGFALWIVLMVKAYQGEKFKLPIIGDIADSNS